MFATKQPLSGLCFTVSIYVWEILLMPKRRVLSICEFILMEYGIPKTLFMVYCSFFEHLVLKILAFSGPQCQVNCLCHSHLVVMVSHYLSSKIDTNLTGAGWNPL